MKNMHYKTRRGCKYIFWVHVKAIESVQDLKSPTLAVNFNFHSSLASNIMSNFFGSLDNFMKSSGPFLISEQLKRSKLYFGLNSQPEVQILSGL